MNLNAYPMARSVSAVVISTYFSSEHDHGQFLRFLPRSGLVSNMGKLGCTFVRRRATLQLLWFASY